MHQHGAKIFNKMCSFKVSIGLLPLLLSSHQKNTCYRSFIRICQHAAKIFIKMCSFEVSIGLITPHFNCLIKRSPVIEVSWKSVNMEPRYLRKCAILKLAYSCHCPHSNHLIKRITVIEGHVKIHQQWSKDI